MAEIKNNKEEVPLQHYIEQYAAIDPERRSKELEIPFTDGRFMLSFLGYPCAVNWPDGTFFTGDCLFLNSSSVKILLLRYLISGFPCPFSGKYYSFRELPWGNVYLQPFTGRCLNRSAWKFNSDPESFVSAAERIGAKKLPPEKSDACLRFDLIGDYHLLFYLWKGDDEFPPAAQILFSDNCAAGFSAEENVVAAEIIISAVSAEMKKRPY